MKLRPASVRVRLALGITGALALIVLAMAAGLLGLARLTLFDHLERHLDESLAAVLRIIESDPREVEDPREMAELESFGVILVFAVDVDGAPLYRSDAWRRAGLELRAGQQLSRVITPGMHTRHPFWISQRTATIGSRGITVAVAEDAEPSLATLRALRLALLISIPSVLLAALAGGLLLANHVVAPVSALAANARLITADDLSARLPVSEPEDEFGQLAITFNAVLARLEDAFDRLRRFTSDASHELRTPLTALRSVGEVGLSEDTTVEELQDVIGSMLEEAERLTRLVDSLLVLTRADAGRIELRRERFDLSGLVATVAEHLGVLAEEKEQTVETDLAPSITIDADRTLLRQAVINVVDNALKYTPEKGRILISTRRRDATREAVVEVADNGPGIPPWEHDRVFERFYRLGADRASSSGGAGLGLAIARWAVEANGGRIELEGSEGTGATFRLVLPLLPSAGPAVANA